MQSAIKRAAQLVAEARDAVFNVYHELPVGKLTVGDRRELSALLSNMASISGVVHYLLKSPIAPASDSVDDLYGEYECSLDARGWQLYGDDLLERSEKAAKELSAELTLRVSTARSVIASGADRVVHGKSIRDCLYETMDLYADLGARDTEPECVLVAEIEKALGMERGTLER